MLNIRLAEKKDLEDITKIYNVFILKSVSTFDLEPKSMDEQERWFAQHGSKYPIIVAELDGEIIGWAALSKYSNREAYSDTSEISLYLVKNHHGKGIGKKMMESIIQEGKKGGLHTIIARITEGNEVSVNLHKEFGFFEVGMLREAGVKFGKHLDVYMMQKIYD